MKFNRKHLTTLVATLLIATLTHPVTAHDFEVNGIYYLKNGTNATVTYRGTSYDQYTSEYSGNVVIPTTVTYSGTTYSVTSIGNHAFRWCSGLTSITIPNSVTTIGNYAFEGCSGLKSVTIGNSVTSIGDYAFEICNGLTSVHISDLAAWCNIAFGSLANPLSYAHHLFLDGTEVKDLVIPNSVTSIGNSAFSSCSGLTSVTIGNSVTTIGNSAFSGCSGLTSITIPNSVTSIGISTFFGCSGLTSVTIPNSVTSIGNSAFYNCSGLTSVTIPNSVSSISQNMFAWCRSLTSVTIPNSVTSIGDYAFKNCSGLASVTIPSTVTSIGNSAFNGCNGIKSLVWNAINCTGRGGMPTSNIETVKIGNSVQSLPNYFVQDSKITSVTIPNSVISIGNSAFQSCANLTSVTIPTSVTTIGNSAFQSCIGLSSITVPSSVSNVGSNVFSECSGLRTVNWNIKTHANFTNSNSPFKGLTGITEFNFGNDVEYIPAFLCDGLSGITSVTIPNSVTSIGLRAISACTGLTSIIIPNSVSSIGSGAFYGCSGLNSVSIGESVETIGDNAFGGCTKLKSISWNAISCTDFKSNSSSIPFYGMTGITSFTFSNNVEHIPAWLCSGLIGLNSLSVPNSVTSIGEATFSGCSGLTSVTIGNSVKSIGNDAFYKCSGLTSVTIPNSLTTIGNGAFYGCSGLTSVTIPNSVTSIGSGAFSSCSGLKYVICKPTTPPTITNSNTFSSSIPILIPTGTMTTYKNANYWKNYNLRYTLTKITPYRTHATIVSEDKEISHLVKVKLNNKEYSVSNDSILIDGLQPRNYNEYENNHTAVAFCKVLGEDRVDTIQFRTMPLNFIEMSGSSTQSTITPKFKVDRADEHGIKISITSSGASYGYPSKDYSGRIIEETDDYYVIETAPITGLTPNSKIYYIPWVTCNGKKCEGPQYNITTQNIGTSSNVTTGPTNVEMTGSYNAGDATVKDAYFTFNGQQMKKIVMTGLRPSTTYSTVYTVVTNTGRTFSTNMSFTTKSLTMTTQEARMLSDTSPMLIAETNMADVETSCGFEWRRYDAPEEMPSAKVYCPVYGGTMAGVLKNMSPNVYYKYRPFYKASDGSEYYGNWIAFITADAGVTFEPVVYTYKAPEVTQNTATLQGVALPGSSEITEQGFEYWRMNGSKAPTGTVNKVTATGQRMSATVQGLNAGATYGYRSYVKAGGQTYYGSEEQFTTEKPTGDVNGDGTVNVSDVTTLVNMILGVIPKDNTRADIDGNGTVNVSDVTALVNLILGIH